MEQYILKHIPGRSNFNSQVDNSNSYFSRPYKSCNLCNALEVEKHKQLKYGYLLKAKYPAVPNSRLYVRNKCSTNFSIDNIIEILYYLKLNPNDLCVCNMLNDPTIPSHWHTHLFSKNYIHETHVNKWMEISKRIPNNHLKYINNNGHFYIYSFMSQSPQENLSSIKNIYDALSTLITDNLKILLSLSQTYLLFCAIDKSNKKLSISSHALYGYFFTSKKEKFNYMKSFGTQNILKKVTIKL